MNDKHQYEVNLQWESERKGVLNSVIYQIKLKFLTH